jgi:hypothetical protein
MRNLYKQLAVLTLALFAFGIAWGQGSPNYQGGLKVKLNEEGSKYFRLIVWHQFWATQSLNEGAEFDPAFSLRRSRFLMYSQLNKRFLILTHFGLNTLNTARMGALSPADPGITVPGRGFNGSFFLHDAWVEYTVAPKKLYIGAGLHYWNGVSRLTNQSTLNIMTLDAPLSNWFTIGITDQFARHMGIYAKGKLGKLDYRISVNEAVNTPILGQANAGQADVASFYGNVNKPGGGKIVSGYFTYEFLEQEGNTLPYFVGTYLGTKKVFNIGAGFFNHFNGTTTIAGGDTTINNALSLGFDVFYDTPLGDNGSALTLYGVAYLHDWGENVYGGLASTGSGTVIYTQAGYVLPDFSEKVRLQPYVALSLHSLDAWENLPESSASELKLGANLYMEGHHAKITAEYVSSTLGTTPLPTPSNQLRIQAMLWF